MPLDPKQAFTLSVNPSRPDDSFFYNDIFDFLPFEDYPEDDGLVPACCLHLSGFAKNGLPDQLLLIHSLPRLKMMTLPLSCARLYCLLSVTTLWS